MKVCYHYKQEERIAKQHKFICGCNSKTYRIITSDKIHKIHLISNRQKKKKNGRKVCLDAIRWI